MPEHAVKRPRGETERDKSQMRNEAKVLKMLSDNLQSMDYVPTYYAFFDSTEVVPVDMALHMEYLATYTTAKRMAKTMRTDGFPPEDLLDAIAFLTLEALVALEAVGVAHRDINPGNIMCRTLPDGTIAVKLIDFAFSELRGDVENNAMAANAWLVSRNVDMWNFAKCLRSLITGSIDPNKKLPPNVYSDWLESFIGGLGEELVAMIGKYEAGGYANACGLPGLTATHLHGDWKLHLLVRGSWPKYLPQPAKQEEPVELEEEDEWE